MQSAFELGNKLKSFIENNDYKSRLLAKERIKTPIRIPVSKTTIKQHINKQLLNIINDDKSYILSNVIVEIPKNNIKEIILYKEEGGIYYDFEIIKSE